MRESSASCCLSTSAASACGSTGAGLVGGAAGRAHGAARSRHMALREEAKPALRAWIPCARSRSVNVPERHAPCRPASTGDPASRRVSSCSGWLPRARGGISGEIQSSHPSCRSSSRRKAGFAGGGPLRRALGEVGRWKQEHPAVGSPAHTRVVCRGALFFPHLGFCSCSCGPVPPLSSPVHPPFDASRPGCQPPRVLREQLAFA